MYKSYLGRLDTLFSSMYEFFVKDVSTNPKSTSHRSRHCSQGILRETLGTRRTYVNKSVTHHFMMVVFCCTKSLLFFFVCTEFFSILRDLGLFFFFIFVSIRNKKTILSKSFTCIALLSDK